MAEALHLKKTSVQGIFELWEAQLNDYTGELHCNPPGLEFLVPPYPVHEIRQNHKIYKTDPRAVLIFNGAHGHVEKFIKAKVSLKSIVIEPKYLSELCGPLAIKAEDIEFDHCGLVQDQQLENQIKLVAGLSDLSIDPTVFSLDCMTSEILITTLLCQKHSQSERVLKEASLGHFPAVMPRIKTILHKNIENPLFNLDILARESGLSKFHLIRTFKKNTGISPAKYLGKIKIDLAKHYLLKSKKSVLSIAMDLGFGDLSTFNKAFKKASGISPSSFRQNS
jgi:AraC-like DNA-binding protein